MTNSAWCLVMPPLTLSLIFIAPSLRFPSPSHPSHLVFPLSHSSYCPTHLVALRTLLPYSSCRPTHLFPLLDPSLAEVRHTHTPSHTFSLTLTASLPHLALIPTTCIRALSCLSSSRYSSHTSSATSPRVTLSRTHALSSPSVPHSPNLQPPTKVLGSLACIWSA